MCGIVGIVGAQNADLIERMNASLLHRGPDEGAVFRDGSLSIGMRRLSIIDKSGGHQPMLSSDGRYALVYNGEIFNAGSLRTELEACGVRFTTDHSDTEVLFELLIRHGSNALNRLNGMFAFAFVDRHEQTVLCARDRFGIKPFYFSRQGGRFAFASEIKALLELPWIERSPDLQSLFHYFSLHFVPGTASAFAAIERLAPGNVLEFDIRTGKISMKRWWAPVFGGAKRESRYERTARLEAALERAVESWMISDEPMGCLLSGGLDSSAIVSLLAQRGHKLTTFTVGFTGPGEAAWDELHLAKQIANKWGTDHHEIILDPEALLEDLIDMVCALDEPYGGGLPSWLVFKAMRPNIKVAMTGSGGDELFGNYNKYQFLEGRLRGRLPYLARKKAGFDRFRQDFFERYYYSSDPDKRNVVLDSTRFADTSGTLELLWERFAAGPESRSIRDRIANMDLETQLPDEFLLMTDRFSMAHSIEARTPFLDHELAGAVYAIDASDRLSTREYKPLLRQIVAQWLPPDLLNAPKRGFVVPIRLWLRDKLQPLLRRMLSPQRLAEQGLVRTDFFERFAAPHIAGVADHTHRLWNMLMFQLWWDVYVVRRPRDQLRAEILGQA